MKRRLIPCLVAVTALAPAAFGATLSLVPHDPGPYPDDGRTVTVDAWLSIPPLVVQFLAYEQLDFSTTDSALELSPHFNFDFSRMMGPIATEVQDELPVPRAWIFHYSTGDETTSASPDGHLIGSIEVTLPTSPGTYTLDAINADAEDQNSGALFFLSAVDPAPFGSVYGGLDGGTLQMTVVPDAGTLALLTIGMLATMVPLVFKRGRDDASA